MNKELNLQYSPSLEKSYLTSYVADYSGSLFDYISLFSIDKAEVFLSFAEIIESNNSSEYKLSQLNEVLYAHLGKGILSAYDCNVSSTGHTLVRFSWNTVG